MSNIIQRKNYRFTIITDKLIRMEYAIDNQFEDRKTQFAQNRDFGTVDYHIFENRNGHLLEIETDYFHLYYDGGNFDASNLFIDVKYQYTLHDAKWYYGEPVHNLGGTAKTLDLTDSEREVVSYLYNHMSEVKKMGIIEVAEKTLVSKSTVLRLSQKLGYSGFSEMKKYLTNLDVQQTVNQRNSNLVESLRIEEENFFEYLENINFDMLTKVFFRSKNIYLYATGSTQAAYLQIFYSQLILLNLPAKLIFGQTSLEATLESIDDSDLLIVVSYGGETEHIKEPMRVISASGATVISVTSFGQNFLVKHAKYSLFYEGIPLSNYNVSMIQLGQLLDFLIHKLQVK